MRDSLLARELTRINDAVMRTDPAYSAIAIGALYVC